MNNLPARWPGVVESYEQATRTCRVSIPGVTDGANEFPIAQIEQAVGDKSEHTEVRILPGDRVWLAFEAGDPRFPIITGFRAKGVGNAADWRRWHHANVEIEFDAVARVNGGSAGLVMDAGGTINMEAGTTVTVKSGATTVTIGSDGSVQIQCTSLTATADSVAINAASTTVSGTLSVAGAISSAAGVSAPLLAAASSLVVAGKEMSGHTHPGVERGGGVTDPPA